MTAPPPPTAFADRRHPRGRILAPAAAVVAVVLSLSACAGSPESGNAPAQAPLPQAAEDASGSGGSQFKAADSAGAAARADKPVTGPSGAVSPDVVRARLIRTAQVTLEVSGRLDVAAAGVKQLAKQFDGHVESETTGLGDTARQEPAAESGAASAVVQAGESLIVLRIPEPRLDDAIAAVTGTAGGRVLSQTSSSQDVTADLADLTSRVASQRASLDRVRALMARATSLQDVVTLESELSRRQSDLEALQSRLATISDQADLSTLTVLLRTPAAKDDEPDTGFLAGLRSAWQALNTSTTVVLTVLGALLPIAVVVGLLGWPALRVIRRRAGRRTAVRPSAGQPYGSAARYPGPGQPRSGTDQPGTGQPGTDQPGTGQPGTG